MMTFESDSNDPKLNEKMAREMMGPHSVDHVVRQAITLCWMILPEDKKSIHAVESEIRRIVDRALKDLREDATAFGMQAK